MGHDSTTRRGRRTSRKDGVLCAAARRLSGRDTDDNGQQGGVGAWES
jgi:hypothetical protein